MRDDRNRVRLVDIRSIAVDRELPQRERTANFVRELQDPEHYKCRQFNITSVYANNGISLEDCLRGMMA